MGQHLVVLASLHVYWFLAFWQGLAFDLGKRSHNEEVIAVCFALQNCLRLRLKTRFA